MNIPEHVRRQAMDAVAPFESTGYIRRHSTAAPKRLAADCVTRERGDITDETRKKAMDAIAECRLTTPVREARHDGRVFAMATPTEANTRSAAYITTLSRLGASVDTVHRTATQDYFGRDHD